MTYLNESSHTQFTPEPKIVIDTVIDNWMDIYDRRLACTNFVEDLKESLYENLKEYLVE